MRRYALAASLSIALHACAGAQLHPSALQVPLLDVLPADGEYQAIGPVEASAGANFNTPAGNNEAVRVEIRNRAAALGAALVVITDYSPAALLNFASIKGIAYRRKGAGPPAAAALVTPAQQREPAATTKTLPAGKLAVLDFRNYVKEMQPETVRYFTDVVRSAAVRKGQHFQVMTRENLLVLLQASGKTLEGCEGECEVETGRRIGADVVVSGDLQRVGTKLKLSLRLHETQGGRLLAAEVASGKSVDDLDTAATEAADRLLAGQ